MRAEIYRVMYRMVHKYGWNWGITRGLINRRFGTNYTADELKELYDDLQDITYKDTESYINILYKKNTRKWICRLKLTDTVKTLIVPDEEKKGQKFNLTSVYDLEQYNDLLHKTLARYM